MVRCADQGNITGFLIDWEPPSHKDKWSTAAMTASAVAFAGFSNQLATALHAVSAHKQSAVACGLRANPAPACITTHRMQ